MTKRIFRAIFIVSALVLLAGLCFMLPIFQHSLSQQLERQLQEEAGYLALGFEREGISYLAALPQGDSRITLIAADGTILFDNQAAADEMENHNDRAEVQAARDMGEGFAARYSKTLAEKTLYYAKALPGGQVLRLAAEQITAVALLRGLLQPLCLIFVAMLILSGIIADRSAKKIVEPINAISVDNPSFADTYDEIHPLILKINHQQDTIRQQLAEAKQQQKEFALITEHMEEGLFIIDQQAHVLSYNSSGCRILGAEAEIGQNILSYHHSQAFCKAVEAALRGEHHNTTLTIDQQIYQLIANPVLQEGQISGAVLLLLDITEKSQREALRREFTGNVSHELKTPLTSISGFAEIIQNGLVKPEDVPVFAGKIFTEAQRLISLVNDIIKISRLDEDAFPQETTPIDLYQAAAETIQRFTSQAEKQQVRLTLSGQKAVITGVLPVLTEVLDNLCDNAIKYNRPGGSVNIAVQENKNAITLTVEDTGIGIPPAEQQRVFERFYRVEKSHDKTIGGTGLGLAIVKHGAAFLGAAIQLESNLGQGTKITLSWPKTEADAKA